MSAARCWAVAALLLAIAGAASAGDTRRLPLREYRDRMRAGWIGQMAGVAWGAPTEFRYRDRIMPAADMPRWEPRMINDAFGQDDLYVEMTFLRTLEQYGWDVPTRQAGLDFANSRYPLWCANNAGRTNLRNGIAPPDSGHPRFNRCPNDIDYQIEADFSGLIAPGLPNTAVRLGETFGRLMNYGDGVYGGQFVGALYAEAFFQPDRVKLVEAALRAIPEKCQYAEMVRDMLRWFRDNPDDWEKTWHLCQKKYRQDPEYQKASNGGIDVKINGAYVLMGLLYGGGDPDRTITIATRCGQDSDCNPSSAAGVLFTTQGPAGVPQRFTKALDEKAIFSHTAYTFPALLAVCEKLARQAVVRAGGRVDRDAAGEEVFLIPVQPPRPGELQLSWAPGPVANSRFTPEEMARITEGVGPSFKKFLPGWALADCGSEMDPGLKAEWGGRKSVFVTHPRDKATGCTLARTVDVPPGRATRLRLVVGHHPRGDWTLIVRADGKELLRREVGPATASGGWLPIAVDLSPFAGKAIKLELVNQPSGWSNEAAYWAGVAVESE